MTPSERARRASTGPEAMSREVNDGWVCIRHRCVKHYDVPAQNVNEASGAECGGCIAEERELLRAALNEQMKNTLAHQRRADVALDWHRLAVEQRDTLQARLDEAQNIARMNGAERDALRAELDEWDAYLVEQRAKAVAEERARVLRLADWISWHESSCNVFNERPSPVNCNCDGAKIRAAIESGAEDL